MNSKIHSTMESRRDFLKQLIFTSAMMSLGCRHVFAASGSQKDNVKQPPFNYQYRTLSVDHFKDLQEDIDIFKRRKKISKHKVFRSYIDDMKFTIPPNFPEAKSIIVMATFTKLMFVNFQVNGEKHEIMLPPQYYDDGLSIDDLTNAIHKEIIKEPGHRIERAKGVHLKLLAVRSGLGKYGKNNLCFVDGMGTYLTLFAFYTDFQFVEDHWQDITMLDACRECWICLGLCPTGCITRENFVIDVGKCLTLYNEIDGKFPKFIRPKMHNALMGCMKCQLRCPVNEKALNYTGRLVDVNEEETEKILQGKPDDKLLETLSQKLQRFAPATSREYFPIFTRNLGVLIG